ncbi:hypothetical protein POJ06DRAFT_260833 [Lipomyces tetrasporus]|uniref:Zn(2)-C6 fungal-type domain-containing protein n=1 Tax=Lipomyces tetrasporus TaxID=54092 RepID=A0AAD7QMH5_9ASCO|nr:uncharacterized protein POJ06DRAFT_260833 [Lipomyces tetrasporus]KAJ8098060.1 hypothetical protein POJ06DRAFT_260833 [Lipomyces tetrasporus]
MVFCGRPSKACRRCRDRKLRCDLRSGSCRQCVRARVACTGYRDTQQLRIRDESQAVRRKVLSRNASTVDPHSLTVSLELQARDIFFANYVTGTSKSWDFLKPFSNPTLSPEHLTLSIDAVSLAYLSHQVYSDTALATAKERYVSALRMMNKALRSPEVAITDATLLASLLLDLFEKITNREPRNIESWTAHVNGALALVRLRGLEQFQDHSALRIMARLSTNVIISCVASDTRVPHELIALRTHTEKFLDVGDPKWRLSDLMVHYTNLRSDIRRGHLCIEECINISLELDGKLQALTRDMPRSWRYKTTIVDRESDMIYNHHFDSYPDRYVTQTWNVLRLVRVLLNESVLDYCLPTSGGLTAGASSLLVRMAYENIKTLACEICASVPQYVGCRGAARGWLLTPEESTLPQVLDSARDGGKHLQSPSQIFDCYTLIFPLYVAGRSSSSPNSLKLWVIKQLYYISIHFDIRNAELVGRILEEGTHVNIWTLYAILGSYAFVA